MTRAAEKSYSVLIVDDDPTIRILISEALGRAGFKVQEAADGATALEMIRRKAPDVILLDVEMPGLSGFDTCREIRKIPAAEWTPIIIVTGRNDHISVEQAYDSGATDYVAKPLNWAVLSHHVRYVAQASESHKKLAYSESRLTAILKAMPDVIFRMNRDGTYLHTEAGTHAEAISGHADFIGRNSHDVLPAESSDITDTSIQRALLEDGVQSYEYTLPVDGQTRHFEARLVASENQEVMAIVRDITDRKLAEEKIRYLAYYDVLTALPNRRHYEQSLSRALMYAKRHDCNLAVMFIDLDHFKLINDTLGHNVGDSMLISVAERLKKCLRPSDVIARHQKPVLQPNLARIGGDEFILLLNDVRSQAEPEAVARRIIQELSLPIIADGHEVFVTPSIGIAIFPEDGEEAGTLIKNADAAMYHAKAEGRNGYRYYTTTLNDRSRNRLELENSLRKALDKNEFILHYQPIIDLQTRRISAFEVLTRWERPSEGLVSPAHFIPVAEECGLIIPIGKWVLEAACAQAMRWQEAGMKPMRVAVNVSSRQIRHPQFFSDVTQALSSSGLDPRYLEIEITESVLLQTAPTVVDSLTSLKEMGVHLSVDDFGTGYSSLTYLKKFPLDILKIDHSFIGGSGAGDDDRAIVTAIIAMARSLNLNIVAEGVETPSQLQFLLDLECSHAQGYLFSKPLPADAALKQFDAIETAAQTVHTNSNLKTA